MSTRPKIAAKYFHIIMPLVLTFLMTCIVSGISTFLAVGFSPILPIKWLSSWMVSWAVAFPVMVLCLPFAKKLVLKFVEKPANL